MKTKIFISCGQRVRSNELKIAKRIEKLLKKFYCYIAVEVQSVRGLRENIFNELKTSEYFLFIDFKREAIVVSTRDFMRTKSRPKLRVYRGSLFTHQELAIASFLEIETMAFHEEGIRWDDGMRGCMQLNSEVFKSRYRLAERVAEAVSNKWESGWKNGLSIELSPGTGGPSPQQDGRMLWHYHLAVRNMHRIKIARDCMVFIEEVANVSTGETKKYETIELKWGGSMLPSATILPGTIRRFDSFQIAKDSPEQILFKVFSDSGEFRPHIKAQGTHRVTFTVVSNSFDTVKKTFAIRNNGFGIEPTIEPVEQNLDCHG